MKYRFYFLFGFFSLLLLFYPGDSPTFQIFAQQRALFDQPEPTVATTKLNPVPYVVNAWEPFVSAQGIYVVDLPSFTPVLERNAHDPFLPASTTKIITALVATDVYQPEDVITIKDPLGEGQIMGLIDGEKITVENLLYGTLVHSGNDAAYALAQHYGFDRFVELMNQKARRLGMKDTVFRNPAGLDDFNQHSTPFDLALAARALLSHPYLAKIASTKEIIISDVDFKYFHKLTNVNQLLGEIQGIGGLKTGYTENAGENLVSFYKHDGHQFIIVILKSDDRFSDTKNIVQWLDTDIAYFQP